MLEEGSAKLGNASLAIDDTDTECWQSCNYVVALLQGRFSGAAPCLLATQAGPRSLLREQGAEGWCQELQHSQTSAVQITMQTSSEFTAVVQLRKALQALLSSLKKKST